jgi:predicted TPR repeat methyltransferase
MDSHITAAALGAAMELGLFWLLDERPMDVDAIAATLQIPVRRCHYWLQHLLTTGLLEQEEGNYVLSSVARTTILDSSSQATWAFLARESRERFPAVLNLTERIREPVSTWDAQGLKPPDYIDQMIESPERAEEFTRMLLELHQSLAEKIAKILDLSGVERLLDLGGGSGVISHALLRRNPDLSVLIMDIPNVCAAGRKIAKEMGLKERLTYLEANFIEDELPSGFDVIMQCDVGEHDDAYLHKIWSNLERGGRLVLVEQFESEEGAVPEQYKYWAFPESMADPGFSIGTLAGLNAKLEEVGFQIISQSPLNGGDARFNQSWVLTEAHKE